MAKANQKVESMSLKEKVLLNPIAQPTFPLLFLFLLSLYLSQQSLIYG
jgi:hypothetical protein